MANPSNPRRRTATTSRHPRRARDPDDAATTQATTTPADPGTGHIGADGLPHGAVPGHRRTGRPPPTARTHPTFSPGPDRRPCPLLPLPRGTTASRFFDEPQRARTRPPTPTSSLVRTRRQKRPEGPRAAFVGP